MSQLESINSFAKRFMPTIDLFALFWFVVSNHLAFDSNMCIRNTPILYFSIFSFALVDYLLILILLSECLSTVLRFPLLLCTVVKI